MVEYLVVGTVQGVQVWLEEEDRLKRIQQVNPCANFQQECRALSVTATGRVVVGGEVVSVAALDHRGQLHEERVLDDISGPITALCGVPTSGLVVGAARYGSVCVWQGWGEWACLHSLQVEQWALSLAGLPDGRVIVGCQDCTVLVWGPVGDKDALPAPTAHSLPHPYFVTSLSTGGSAADGHHVAVGLGRGEAPLRWLNVDRGCGRAPRPLLGRVLPRHVCPMAAWWGP